ncbi:MAG TPA: toll/interleukin-1 receptor domain-containing protein [Solirubrobacterales bacterium]
MQGDHESTDVFIAHAGEDKEAVARPLADALLSLGWAVWLDELKLTIGDSLSRRIDDALSRTRFGVVVLSPDFFAKEWPRRELAGLAAREVDGGSKVILPVWHNVDHAYIVQHSPTLADRLGALTSAGIENVAQEISLALRETAAVTSTSAEVDSAETTKVRRRSLLTIPTTADERSRLVQKQSDWWEYRLYAGALMEGRIGLEGKWHDHRLRLPAGLRRDPPEDIPAFLSREMALPRRSMLILDRLFDAAALETAFGPPGTAGDAELIESISRGVIQTYESMMDWAAALRGVSVPGEYDEVTELTAGLVNGPVRQIRDFIQLVADQIARIPVLLKEAEAKGATTESPMSLELVLHVELDGNVEEELHEALGRLT